MIYPLLVADKVRRLFPLGTAFRLSKLGHVLTARHNVEEGFRKHHPNSALYVREGLEGAKGRGDLKHINFAVLNQGPNPKIGHSTLDVRGFSSMHAAFPTDLLVGSLLNDEASASVLSLVPTVSFAPPRIGETVRCLGFTSMRVPDEGLPFDGAALDSSNPFAAYEHRLLCYEARVTNHLLGGVASGFVEAPCFSIDAELPHGLSGGPVFNSDGNVCGVVCAGATSFFSSPSSIASLLYPIFTLELSFSSSHADGIVQINATGRPVSELVATRAILTDRAEEERVHLTREEGGLLVGATFHKDDMPFVFENFRALQNGTPMTPMPPGKSFVLKPNLEHPLVRKRQGLEEED